MISHSFSFPSDGDALVNARALQTALDTFHDVTVINPGVYDVAGTIFLSDHTHVTFAPGVILKRQPDPSGKNGYFFVNRGAFTGTVNEDIAVIGLSMLANSVESAAAQIVPHLPELAAGGADALNAFFDTVILGLRAHLAFLYVKDLVIRDFTLPDLCAWDYGVQISDFENVTLENIRIEGNKDGVHFGPGRHFVLKNGVFRTKDDPIALNADDYSPSGATIGMLEDGLIENCVDENQDSTFGYFIRLHVGAACPWTHGMTVTHSDSVMVEDRLYRTVLPADHLPHVSLTPPTHEEGFAVLDGIPWVRVKPLCPSPIAAVRNVTLKDLTVEKDRDAVVLLYMSDNEHHHGWREGAPVPVTENVTFENVRVTGNIRTAFWFCAPEKNLTLKDCDLNGGAVRFEQGSCGFGAYPASFTLENVKNFRLDDGDAFRDPPEGAPHYPVKY